MNLNTQQIPTRASAFSLVEVLIAVAIIGIFASMAFAYFGGLNPEHFKRIRDQRNAQEIASLTMGATAAGASVIEPGDTPATVRNLMEGRTGTHGPFNGRIFRLSRLSNVEIAGAAQYLVWDNGMICYVSTAH